MNEKEENILARKIKERKKERKKWMKNSERNIFKKATEIRPTRDKRIKRRKEIDEIHEIRKTEEKNIKKGWIIRNYKKNPKKQRGWKNRIQRLRSREKSRKI